MHATASAPTTPRSGPPSAVRSSSNGSDRLTLLPSPPAAAISLRRPPEHTRRRLMSPPTASISAASGSFLELTTAADFASVASPGGRISVIGFGSLLSERSARSTFPELEGFRVAALRGFRRVFAHVAPIFFERGIAVEATKVVPQGLDGVPFTNSAVVCARYSDEEYFQERCKGSKEVYNQRYGRYNIDKIWRDDILPCRLYLRHCVLAAKNLGEPHTAIS
ncbi:hypothetical protein PR202_ga04409 [Eleusine coracana subsp. coracana]|uniref:Uncharacterized protein n=1 Tax=Eleusine coracana subsp. coracana TaxID=191504 RepID=A0AAV5BRH2_ELECO|nr:hypothetical protein PR202_ga04409 [Eleusine coracana subsp. coracana]